MPSTKEQILSYIGTVEQLGEQADKTRYQGVDAAWHSQPDAAGEFHGSYQHLLAMLGPHAASCHPPEKWQVTWISTIRWCLGNLRSIRHAIDSGLLVSIQSLVAAEVFSDFLEQADHLHGKGFHVAAAVVGRGVLEEHLRKWCNTDGLTVPANAGISDLNTALYKASKYDKAAMHHINSLAAVGNDAAHNQKATNKGVEQMLSDIRRFLAQNKIS